MRQPRPVLMDVLNNARSQLSELAVQGKVLSADAQVQPFSYGGIGVIEAGFAKGGDPKQAQARSRRRDRSMCSRTAYPPIWSTRPSVPNRRSSSSARTARSAWPAAWSQALAWQGLDSPEEAEQQIQAVTVDDVNRVAREYLKPDQRVTVVLTPDPNGKRPPNSAGFGGSRVVRRQRQAGRAAAGLGEPRRWPGWTCRTGRWIPTSMKLDNGITLIVQPESVSKTVTVVGHVDHDDKLQEPKGQDGVGRLLASLFDYGTTTLDRNAFHKALDAIAANESRRHRLPLAVPSAHFDEGMRLLADNELHPALPQQAFDVQQKTLARTLAGELQSPQLQDDPRAVQGTLPGNRSRPCARRRRRRSASSPWPT